MLNRKDAEVSPGCDVWALGVVLFMLLTGEHPFAHDMSISDEEMSECVLRSSEQPDLEATLFHDDEEEQQQEDGEDGEEADSACGGRSSVSPLARDLIVKMLRKDPAQRATAEEVLHHPWFQSAAEGLGRDRATAAAGRRIRGQGHGIHRHGHGRFGGPAPTTPEELHKFWSARRRMKACLLAIMSGVVDGEYLHFTDEEKEAERTLWAPVGMLPGGSNRGHMGKWTLTQGRSGGQGKGKLVLPRHEAPPRASRVRPGAGVRPNSFASTMPSLDADAGTAFTAATAAALAAGDRKRAARNRRKAAAAAAAAKNASSGKGGQNEQPLPGADASEEALRRGRRPSYPIGSREAACAMVDRGCKGYITMEDIEYVTKLMGERFTQSEIREMMMAMDGDPETESCRVPYDQMAKVIPPLCTPRQVSVGTNMYREGEMDPSFYLLTKGMVEFSVSALQGKAPLQRQGPGKFFYFIYSFYIFRAIYIYIYNFF